MKTPAFLLIGCLAANTVRAYDVTGHMIIAQVAHERLNDHAKEKLKELSSQLKLNGQPLNAVNIAAWADEIKHQHGGTFGGHYKNWHFIDIGCVATDPNPLENPPRLSIQNGDVVTALEHCVAVIKDGQDDPFIPNEAVALALIVHLVGDIHQPLHCTTHYYTQPKVEPGHKRPDLSDGGGNAVAISNFDNKYPELHQFWDVAYNTQFQASQVKSGKDLDVKSTTPDSSEVKTWAETVKTAAPPASTDLHPDFRSWAKETHPLGCSDAYGPLQVDEEGTAQVLTATYSSAARELTLKRMCLAGFRLSELLNSLYP